ncbi:cytochrome c biogenesis heme-transporting ATPase CcmA [Hydrogenophaga sp.]|jgi:heme exporter protein A|uniref:cytochrome c biogenesis heme-transporting ATPase CcmA n=1 Tax=Hydrogenophaga sp. TaxID=1904254 RepID=UPI003F6F020C
MSGDPALSDSSLPASRAIALLEVENLACERGNRLMFKSQNFQVEAGTGLWVHGENGSGKTSLLRVLAGLSPPAAGEVRWNGVQIKALGAEYRRTLTYCGHLAGLKDDLTAEENLLTASTIAGKPITTESARAALREVGLAGRLNLPARALSQGQRRRVGLARLLCERVSIWMLDEPLAGLDTRTVDWLSELIDGHLSGGGLVVLTSHQEISVAKSFRTARLDL